jgi:hypothetical protein
MKQRNLLMGELMKTITRWFAIGMLVVLWGGQPAAIAQQSALKRDYPVKPVPFTAVHFNDVFWAPRIETNRSRSRSLFRSAKRPVA